jgi:uncharacterized protein YbjT (DUF2867 family)
MKTAVVIGSSGLIGGLLVEKLALQSGFSQIIAVVRTRTLEQSKNAHPKIRWIQFDFLKWGELEMQLRAFIGQSTAVFFCGLGTTIAKAKTEDAFRRVDHDFVVEFAGVAQRCKAESLLVVSAAGADASSGVFYNRVKGEMERDVQQTFLGKIYFLRPSLLLGDRAEFRFGERLAVLLSPLFSPLLLGPFAKYKPIAAADVANALVNLALKRSASSLIVENDEIYKISKIDR